VRASAVARLQNDWLCMSTEVACEFCASKTSARQYYTAAA
jgi:hypothetical protein